MSFLSIERASWGEIRENTLSGRTKIFSRQMRYWYSRTMTSLGVRVLLAIFAIHHQCDGTIISHQNWLILKGFCPFLILTVVALIL